MRIVGLILVALGAAALGWEGFTYVTTEQVPSEGVPATRTWAHTLWIPPVVSAIALVAGLILLAHNDSRDDCRDEGSSELE